MFNQAYLWLKNWNIDTTIGIGVREGGDYKVLGKYIVAMKHHTINPCDLWHRRLGRLHFISLPGLQRMMKGMPSFDFVHDTICRGCDLGMNVKKNFPIIHTISKGILYLVHSTLCRPMSSPSLSGYLYYDLFIDDYSRILHERQK